MVPVKRKDDGVPGVAKIVIVVLVVCLGLWGCARKPDNRAGSNERVRVLESRCQKLEQDYRSVAMARDKARKELAAMEEDNARLHREMAEKAALVKECDELRSLVKVKVAERDELAQVLSQRINERDELKLQVAQRINERDALQYRVESFRKGLQQLLTQDDSPAPLMPSVSPSSGPVLGSE